MDEMQHCSVLILYRLIVDGSYEIRLKVYNMFFMCSPSVFKMIMKNVSNIIHKLYQSIFM